MGDDRPDRWYTGVTRYQWLVLVIASLGWVFDVFEGQIFVASMTEALPALLPPGTPPGDLAFYGHVINGAFLAGGAVGGVAFGVLSDRIGRVRTMTLTILVYSLFTCVSAFAGAWWHMAVCRFLVALGVGGEWAVASALVAEEFPAKARAWSLSIFHASSVFGTVMAVAAGTFVVANPDLGWRWGFGLGALPAFLTLWIRRSLREPDAWVRAKAGSAAEQPSVGSLFRGALARRTLVAVALATVGLATFWGTHIYGKNVLRRAAEVQTADAATLKRWEMLGMLLVTTGGGLGLVSFGPLSDRLGRRGAFLAFHLGGVAAAVVVYQFLTEATAVALFLPVFGFLTLGMHAGYAVYFPELFPTRLRSTGAGFCFNVGRLTAAPVLLLTGWLQKPETLGLSQPDVATLLSLLFLVGACLLVLAPETRGTELAA